MTEHHQKRQDLELAISAVRHEPYFGQGDFSEIVQKLFKARHSESEIRLVENDIAKADLNELDRARLQIACLSARPAK